MVWFIGSVLKTRLKSVIEEATNEIKSVFAKERELLTQQLAAVKHQHPPAETLSSTQPSNMVAINQATDSLIQEILEVHGAHFEVSLFARLLIVYFCLV